jgi:hypothetical protein
LMNRFSVNARSVDQGEKWDKSNFIGTLSRYRGMTEITGAGFSLYSAMVSIRWISSAESVSSSAWRSSIICCSLVVPVQQPPCPRGFSARLFRPKNLLEKFNITVKVGVDVIGSENRGESLRQFGGIGLDVRCDKMNFPPSSGWADKTGVFLVPRSCCA